MKIALKSRGFFPVHPPKGGQRLLFLCEEWVQLIRPPVEAPQRVLTGSNQCRAHVLYPEGVLDVCVALANEVKRGE